MCFNCGKLFNPGRKNSIHFDSVQIESIATRHCVVFMTRKSGKNYNMGYDFGNGNGRILEPFFNICSR